MGLGNFTTVSFAWLGKWRYDFKEGSQLFINVWEQFFTTSNPLEVQRTQQWEKCHIYHFL